MAARVNSPVAPVTQATHPFTHNCEFYIPAKPTFGLITVDGFRNLLEAHIGTLNKAKQVSYTRNRAWLEAIRDHNTTPPTGYAGNQASWKNEIGATNPATSKWVVEDGKVYKKDKKSATGRADAPMTPTEYLYDLMIAVHDKHGHKGRDNFFNLVKTESDSVKKAFCHQFVQVCCDKAESWQGGNVAYGWQAPVKRRNGRENVDDVVAVGNRNDVVDIENGVSPPQDLQPDNQRFGEINFGDIAYDDAGPQIVAANNWNPAFQPTFHDYPTPPTFEGLGPNPGTGLYFSADQNPVAFGAPVDREYPTAGPQNYMDYQRPLPDQDAVAQYTANFNHDMQNNPNFFPYGENEAQLHVQMRREEARQRSACNPYFANEAAQRPAYYPEVEQQRQTMFENHLIFEQPDYSMANYDMASNGMILEQHDYRAANNGVALGEYNQMILDGMMVVDPFGMPPTPPASGLPIQRIQDESEALPGHPDLSNVGDNNAFGISNVEFNNFINDSQMAL